MEKIKIIEKIVSPYSEEDRETFIEKYKELEDVVIEENRHELYAYQLTQELIDEMETERIRFLEIPKSDIVNILKTYFNISDDDLLNEPETIERRNPIFDSLIKKYQLSKNKIDLIFKYLNHELLKEEFEKLIKP